MTHSVLSAVERAMKIQEQILRVEAGQLTARQAAQQLCIDERSFRRWRRRHEAEGAAGLLDRRVGKPSPKIGLAEEREALCRLYLERYAGFGCLHFHECYRARHEGKRGYTWVKNVLQEAGHIERRKSKAPHRRRRPRREQVGELLHIDGSDHAWLPVAANAPTGPQAMQTLIVILDDATSHILYARLWEEESTEAILHGLRHVMRHHGLPQALYSDRASWAFFTPVAGGKVDRSKPTTVGRALIKLGVEQIAAYSPQARGRSERANGTLQGRLVSELRAAGICTMEAANHFLEAEFIPAYNLRFGCKAASAESCFVALLPHQDLDDFLCWQEPRKVAKDNTVRFDNVTLQIPAQPGRRSCAGREVDVCRHLDGSHSVWLDKERVLRTRAPPLTG